MRPPGSTADTGTAPGGSWCVMCMGAPGCGGISAPAGSAARGSSCQRLVGGNLQADAPAQRLHANAAAAPPARPRQQTHTCHRGWGLRHAAASRRQPGWRAAGSCGSRRHSRQLVAASHAEPRGHAWHARQHVRACAIAARLALLACRVEAADRARGARGAPWHEGLGVYAEREGLGVGVELRRGRLGLGRHVGRAARLQRA
jgi:hypothetical protein